MESRTIHFDKSIKDKILKFLSSFSEKDLKISNTKEFENAKKTVHEDYSEYKSGKSELQSLDEFEEEMKNFLSEDENWDYQ